MSKLFVCVGKRAEAPYSILTGRLRIYTIEELCYYICDNLDVLDRSLMQESLADFVEQELGLMHLAEQLRETIRCEGDLHTFCSRILDHAGYLAKEERRDIVVQLRENESLPVLQRLKRQGDTFLEEKQYYKAQRVYRGLLQREDVRQDSMLQAEIYECLGSAAAMLFQYETAAYCFDKSCSFVPQEHVRRKYLLCYRFMMSRQQYLEWVSQREEYYGLSVDVERAYELAKTHAEQELSEHREEMSIELLKEEYCQMVLE